MPTTGRTTVSHERARTGRITRPVRGNESLWGTIVLLNMDVCLIRRSVTPTLATEHAFPAGIGLRVQHESSRVLLTEQEVQPVRELNNAVVPYLDWIAAPDGVTD